MAALNFLQLQAAVMGDRFSEDQRGDVKLWINSSYWSVWTADDWAFRETTALVTVTAGSNQLTSFPTDFGESLALQRSDGTPLTYLSPRVFKARYYDATQTTTGTPEAYTVIAGVFSIGPVSNETKTDYLLTYQREYAALVNDGDVPLLPEGAFLDLLVFGAQARGLKLQNDFTWQFAEQSYMSAMENLRADYLTDEGDDDGSYPSDPVGW